MLDNTELTARQPARRQRGRPAEDTSPAARPGQEGGPQGTGQARPTQGRGEAGRSGRAARRPGAGQHRSSGRDRCRGAGVRRRGAAAAAQPEPGGEPSGGRPRGSSGEEGHPTAQDRGEEGGQRNPRLPSVGRRPPRPARSSRARPDESAGSNRRRQARRLARSRPPAKRVRKQPAKRAAKKTAAAGCRTGHCRPESGSRQRAGRAGRDRRRCWPPPRWSSSHRPRSSRAPPPAGQPGQGRRSAGGDRPGHR